MDRIPTELHHIIASYAMEPIYQLYPCLKDHINWEVLSCNPHPAMVPLIDAYFERCLTIQSHLPHSMLGPLYRNPTARPLVEKYDYFFRKLKRKGPPAMELPTEHSWDDYFPWAQELIKSIRDDTFHNKQLHPLLVGMVYQFPEIFKVDESATKAAITQFVAKLSC